MKKIVLYFFFLLIYFSRFLNSRMITISIPKSGTFLLGKCIELLTNKKSVFGNNNIYLKNVEFFQTHLKCCAINEKLLNEKDLLKFFIYRDPRDQIVSYYFWTHKEINNPNNKEFLNKVFKDTLAYKGKGVNYLAYKDFTIDNFLSTMITDGEQIYDGQGGTNFYDENGYQYKTSGIYNFYQTYLGWLKRSDFCIVKFENLIGAKGNGSEEKQIMEIKKIALHLGLNLEKKDAINIAKKLFGESWTFREGQIGNWKKYFKLDHKNSFKKIAGQLLIDLGYEKDLNW